MQSWWRFEFVEDVPRSIMGTGAWNGAWNGARNGARNGASSQGGAAMAGSARSVLKLGEQGLVSSQGDAKRPVLRG